MRSTMIKLGVQQLPFAGRRELTQIQVVYRVGAQLQLLRGGGLDRDFGQRGQLLGIVPQSATPVGEAEAFVRQVLEEVERWGYRGVVCLFPEGGNQGLGQVVTLLDRSCGAGGLDFLVTEAFASWAEQGKILISTALSGGTLEQRFQLAIQRWGAERVVMDVERMGEDFLLPAPRGCGERVTLEEIGGMVRREGAEVYFSTELCARYFTYQNQENSLRFVLFDDQGTVAEKVRRARKWGLAGVAME